jgi:hypothetical protein
VTRVGDWIAFEPHRSRIALLAEGENGERFVIFCTDAGFQKIVALGSTAEDYDLGAPDWSTDGNTVYVIAKIKIENKNMNQFSLAEIPADGGPVRFVPIVVPSQKYDIENPFLVGRGNTIYFIAVTPTEDEDIQEYSLGEILLEGGPMRLTPIVRAKLGSDEHLFMSLSPDGSTIAAATAQFDKDEVEPADRGLFLVDLRDPARKVTRIQYPKTQGTSGTTPKE